MSWPNHGYTGAVLPRPSIRSIRPLDRCWSIAYSSAMRAGSLVVISVVDVVTSSRLVVAAMYASSVVGAREKNGGLWCSPIANTSRPTSSVFWAILTIASIRSASLGVEPVTGSRVMSLTEKIPNCMFDASLASAAAVPASFSYMRLHVSLTQAAVRYSAGDRAWGAGRRAPGAGRGAPGAGGRGSRGAEPFWARVPLARIRIGPGCTWHGATEPRCPWPDTARSSALGERREAVAAGPLVGFLAEADVLAGGEQVAQQALHALRPR